MKILDRYIFSSFVKTFLAVFVILMFIFVLQGIWLHISELAGKDLDYGIIGKFLLYLTPSLVPLVLPLTILVSSIMVFGGFAENYEFAAMKSSGISLQRAMRSLIFFIGFLSLLALFFTNTVIPWAEFKSINLRYNIRELKPSMAIVEGAFNEIGDVNMKVGKKYGKEGDKFKDVIIHKKNPKRMGNHTVIKAESGELVSSGDKGLALVLYTGNYYDELQPKDYKERRKKPFMKSYFDKYNINIDLSNFNNVDLGETRYNYSYKMLDIPELNESIDSLSQDFNQDKKNFTNNIITRSGARRLGVKENDSLKAERKLKMSKLSKRVTAAQKKDTVVYDIQNIDEFLESYTINQQQQITNIALGSVRGTISNIKGKKSIFKKKVSRLNKTEIQLHEKYALAVACFILFFVGAPLGAIIRKGGLGLPMVIAILLFLTYHFVGIFAKNSAEDGTVSPFVATWLSTFIMFPLSIYLTYRATTDQGFINTDAITEPIKKFFKKIGLGKKKDHQ
ncbi:LptF/LptG family permease [Mesonia aestuariivivens]|uniref:LptF/LptG family permease n=1 Tax=Mesonia aestuariivivens TaxID=2796128 RepID=A0ABS6W2F8_9FLAO|nr:LptF/LptG family permease [Mesonia aestuariivivens]MBW2962025.1 LptF/LptG family permease [Mesonia aestuariivivens]